MPESPDVTLLIANDAARREIGKATREAVERAMAEHGADVRRLYDALVEQRGVLTLARCADLLGVRPRTVTERYVAELGLPCVRLASNQPPLFILADVVAWLRSRGGEGGPEGVGAA